MNKLIKVTSRILVTMFLVTNVLSQYGVVFAEKNTSKEEIESTLEKVEPNETIDGYKEIPKNLTSEEEAVDRGKVEILVKYKESYGINSKINLKLKVKNALKLKKLNTKKKMKYSNVEILEIDESDNIKEVVKELGKDENIEYAHPNYILSITTENEEKQTIQSIEDQYYQNQWGLQNLGQEIGALIGIQGIDINALEAWDITEGTPSTVIGVLDTGIDISHQDLANNIYINTNEISDNEIDDDGNGYIDDIYGWDFANSDNTVFDSVQSDKHGTHVAGIIAAEGNQVGIKGTAPNVRILPLKFITDGQGYTSDAIEAIEYAKQMGIKIINCSFGGTDSNYALKEAMENSDILFICSAGNNGQDTLLNPIYPSAFELPNVISVAALDNQGKLADFSSYGNGVDIVAPGVDIYSTVPENKYEYMSGTSMATPFITGIAGLIKSHVPDLTDTQIARRLTNNVNVLENLEGKVDSSGITDGYKALTIATTDPEEPEENTDTEEGSETDAILISLAAEVSDKLKEQIHYGEAGVNFATGNYSTSQTDMSMSAPGFVIDISRTYNSRDERETSTMGRGWTFGFEGNLKQDTTDSSLWIVKLPNGSVQVFIKNPDGTYSANDSRSTLEKQEDNTHILTTKDQYKYSFDINGYISWMEDRNGNKINIEVDSSNGKVLKISDQGEREFIVSYNAEALISTITDPIGRTVTYEYENNLLVRVIDPTGKITRYGYDEASYLNQISNHNEVVLKTITYDHIPGENIHKVTSTTDVYGNTRTYTYDIVNSKTISTDTNGRQIIKWYDSKYYTIKSEDPESRQTTVEYYLDANGVNKYGEEKIITDRYGNKTEYIRDANGNITKIKNPDESFTEYQYDEKNNLILEKDEEGNTIYYIYDENKINLLKKVVPLNGTDEYIEPEEATEEPTEETTEEPVEGQLTQEEIEEKFIITEYTYYTQQEAELLGYKAYGLQKSEIDPEGNEVTFTYDIYGNTKTVTDAQGNTTIKNYNLIGWLTSQTSPLGYKTEYIYNNNGKLVKTIQDGGETTRIVYDIQGRTIKEISPNEYLRAEDGLNKEVIDYTYSGDKGTRYTYYDNGQVHTKTDSEGNTTIYTYDIYGNLQTVTKPNGSQYIYEYDIMNRLIKKSFKNDSLDELEESTILEEYEYIILSDGKTQKTHTKYLEDTETAVTKNIYDYDDRLIESKNPDGTTSTMIYNKNGTLKRSIDENGATTYYKYDGLNRLTEKWTPIEYGKYSYEKTTYDKAGRIIEISRGKDKVAVFETPVEDRLIKTYYEYYLNGLTKTQSNSNGSKITYYYDKDSNLIKQETKKNPTESNITEYSYDHMGRQIEKRIYVKSNDIYTDDINQENEEEYISLTTTYKYDKNGNLVERTTPDNHKTSYTYDKLNRKLTTTQLVENEYELPVIITTETTYDWNGNPLTTTDGKGNVTEYTYDKSGRLSTTKRTTVENDIETEYILVYNYDRAGRIIAEVSPKDYNPEKSSIEEMNRTEYTYDIMDRKTKEKFIYKNSPEDTEWITIITKAYEYDNKGNITKEQDAMGYQLGYGTEYTYNLVNQLITELDPVSKDKGLKYTVKYEYNGLGRKISETNGKGTIQTYHYDDGGNLVSSGVKKSKDDLEKTLTTNTYDLIGNLITTTDGLGNTTVYEYNNLNKVRKVTYPSDVTIGNYQITYQYDKMGRVAKQQNSVGTVDLYKYDKQGRQLAHIQQDINGEQFIEISTLYDVNVNERFTIDENGVKTENIYDELNRLIETKITVTDIDGVKTEKITKYQYDKNGNQTKQIDHLGNEYTNIYDTLNRVIEKQDPYTVVQRLEYNLNNAQIKSYDSLGNITEFKYDKNNRLVETIDPEGHKTKEIYDILGNVEKKIDGNGNITTYEYDYLNRLTGVINGKQEKTTYTYDLNGNMLTQTDGNGQTTTFEYNIRNKQVKRIDHGGRINQSGIYIYDNQKVENYRYNPDGSMAEKTDRKGQITTYEYDIHGRLSRQTVGENQISYTYDNKGNQLSITNNTGITTRVYDELDRVILKTVPNIGGTTYKYDIIQGVEVGHTKEISKDPKGNITEKTYDKVGRLKTVITNAETTTYNYDGNGNRTSVIYPDGSKEEYTYYTNNLLDTLTNTKADGTIIDTYKYTYDSGNNQITKVDSKGTTYYSYDNLNRLIKVIEPESLGSKTTIYSYDKAGNRTKETTIEGALITKTEYIYNEQNRLLKTITEDENQSKEETNYTYDANGNMIYKKVDTTKIAEPIDEPSFGMFIIEEIETIPSISTMITHFRYDEFNQMIESSSAGQQGTYKYNGEGYRVEKTVNGETTRYLYEYDKVVLEVDDKGNEIAKNTYGTNLISREVEGETAYYFYNGHADVVALMNNLGEILATYYYDAFGNQIEETGTINNPYRYSGYQYDEEQDIYYLNSRYYDAKIARFMTEDTYRGQINNPLSLNLYTYCYNNPIKYWDPTGHIVSQWDIDRVTDKDDLEKLEELTELWDKGNAAEKIKAHDKAEAIRDKYRGEFEEGADDGYTYKINGKNSLELYEKDKIQIKNKNLKKSTSDAGDNDKPTKPVEFEEKALKLYEVKESLFGESNDGLNKENYSSIEEGSIKEASESGVDPVEVFQKVVTKFIEDYNDFAKEKKYLLQIPKVSGSGVSLDLIAGTSSVQVVIDLNGNIGLAITGGMKGKSDFEGGVAFNNTISYNMESVEDMNGYSTFYGGGIDFGEVLAVSGDYAYSVSTTEDNRHVTSHSYSIGGNFSFVPLEINTGVTYTKIFKINIFYFTNKIYNKFKQKNEN